MLYSYTVNVSDRNGEIIADCFTTCHTYALEQARIFRKIFDGCQISIVEHKAIALEDNIIATL